MHDKVGTTNGIRGMGDRVWRRGVSLDKYGAPCVGHQLSQLRVGSSSDILLWARTSIYRGFGGARPRDYLNLVRFGGALRADGGRKLLLDGSRGAAREGGRLKGLA